MDVEALAVVAVDVTALGGEILIVDRADLAVDVGVGVVDVGVEVAVEVAAEEVVVQALTTITILPYNLSRLEMFT